MSRLGLASLAWVLAAVALLPAESPAARTGSCLVPGAALKCSVWTGKVTYIGDGDTIYVDLDGDRTRRSVSVRLIGVNAAEQTVYSRFAARRRGECHALEATARLEQLIRKGRRRVRLVAQDPASHSRQRLRRVAAVRIRGRWQDLGRRLVAEGHALWLPGHSESAWNRDYGKLAQRAASLGRGLWDPDSCGDGPSESSPLKLWVSSDADGRGAAEASGEWIKIRNLDPIAAVPLAGWWVRDSQLRRYTFPAWVMVPPGETITVYVGGGADTFTELFWGLGKPVFENATIDGRALGDGAYLFDPDGDLRAWMQYPCRVACVEPNQGAIEVSARARGREHIMLRNVSDHAVDLEDYWLSTPRHYAYTFSADAVLQPGEAMRIQIRGDPAQQTRLLKHWGETGPILRNKGDVVRLKGFTEITIGCYAYGDRAC